jgi:hypothetical protein
VARKVNDRGSLQSMQGVVKAGLAASPQQAPPFMWLARTPEVLGPANSVSWVQHPLFALRPCELHLEVFLVGPLVSALAMADSPLLTFRPTRTCALSALLLT